MKVTKRDGGGTYFSVEDPEFTVSFSMFGRITLASDDLMQSFRNPADLGYKHLPRMFPSLEKVIESAEVYKEGITNKEKFLKVIGDAKFRCRYNISEFELKQLNDFIKTSRAAPPTVRMQLFMKGFGRISEVIDFEDPRPELLRTCGLFWEFIKASRTI